MNPPENVSLEIELPTPEAADLTSRAAAEGVSTPVYLGYHAMRSAYGVLHPAVQRFERNCLGMDWDELGQSGDEDEEN